MQKGAQMNKSNKSDSASTNTAEKDLSSQRYNQLELNFATSIATVYQFPTTALGRQRSSEDASKRLLEFAAQLPDW